MGFCMMVWVHGNGEGGSNFFLDFFFPFQECFVSLDILRNLG